MRGIIRTENLDVGYEGKAVVRNVDMAALRGHTICLIGPNGSGKSTILRTLSGMLAPVAGTVYIDGNDIREIKPRNLSRKMAVVLTERLAVKMTTAYEIVAMGRMPYTGFFGRLKERDHEIVRNAISTVGANDIAARDYTSLSDGEKQKVLIARALAQEPELLILDEPTSHLDLKHKIEVMRILNRLSAERGLTVILALHDVDIATKNSQFVLLVKDGEVVVQGRPEDVIGADTITSLYEIEGAGYNSVLGSMEICNDLPPQIFVFAGGGTGASTYRFLSRLGIGIATGILYENDIDYAVAAAMQLKIVAAPGFAPVDADAQREARQLLQKSRFAVDTGFRVGPYSEVNLNLLREAAAGEIPLYSFRSRAEIAELYGDLPVIGIETVGALQTVVEDFAADK